MPDARGRLQVRSTICPIWLLAGHGYAESFLWENEMVQALCGLIDGKLHPLDPAIEGVAAWAMVRRDGCASVLADIASVISGEHHRLRHRNGPLASFLAVDIERHLPALAEATARICKLHAD